MDQHQEHPCFLHLCYNGDVFLNKHIIIQHVFGSDIATLWKFIGGGGGKK